jgi:hypothetical protein
MVFAGFVCVAVSVGVWVRDAVTVAEAVGSGEGVLVGAGVGEGGAVGVERNSPAGRQPCITWVITRAPVPLRIVLMKRLRFIPLFYPILAHEPGEIDSIRLMGDDGRGVPVIQELSLPK